MEIFLYVEYISTIEYYSVVDIYSRNRFFFIKCSKKHVRKEILDSGEVVH